MEGALVLAVRAAAGMVAAMEGALEGAQVVATRAAAGVVAAMEGALEDALEGAQVVATRAAAEVVAAMEGAPEDALVAAVKARVSVAMVEVWTGLMGTAPAAADCTPPPETSGG